MIFIIFISETKNGFIDLLRQPNNHLVHPIEWVWYFRIFNITFNGPRNVESWELLTCGFIQVKDSIRMIMQECWRDLIRLFSFNTSLHNVWFAFRPSHNDDFFSLANSFNSHSNCAFRNMLNSSKTFSCILSCESMQINQPGDTFLRGRGLIEANMSCSAYSQNL